MFKRKVKDSWTPNVVHPLGSNTVVPSSEIAALNAAFEKSWEEAKRRRDERFMYLIKKS